MASHKTGVLCRIAVQLVTK